MENQICEKCEVLECHDCSVLMLDKLLEGIEDEIEHANMLNSFQLGITLKVLEDRLLHISGEYSQWCNDLQRKIMNTLD